MPPPIISDWKINFLEKRELKRPTGGYLYSYKMTSSEFDELESLLNERLSAYLKIASLGDVSQHISYFPALFVIYAAEWWHRRYSGAGWSWAPILEDLGANDADWSQAQRSECVEKGLQDWGLQLTNSHGLRFLGSIAFQGGLPMQLLATAQGNIGRVLGRVLRLASTGNFEAKDVQGWIESLSSHLPKAYRLTEVYVLLAEVILSVLRLKSVAKLASAEGAIEKLNQFDPHWRNYFPIPVEDGQAQGLIDQLIRDAAEAILTRPIKKISVVRRLENIDTNLWQLRSDLDIPEYIDAGELAGMFGADASSLTRWLTLRVTRGDQVVEVMLRKLAGQERYRFERRPMDALKNSAIAEHTAALITVDGQIFHNTVARGEALIADLPWLMEEAQDSSNSYRLVRQGSGTLSSLEALIVVPDKWAVNSDEGGEAVLAGNLDGLGRRVWKIKGCVRVEDTSGDRFRIKCGQASAGDDQLEWRGKRVWETFSLPNLAFLGAPKLYKVSATGLVQPVSGSLAWRVPGGRSTLTPNGLNGPVDAIWPAEGDIKWKSRLVLLPENANIDIEPGHSPLAGRLVFSNYGLLNAQLETEGVSFKLENRSNDVVVAHLEYTGVGSPPEWCELRLVWRSNPNEARVRIPFPAKGCRAFDGNGKQLADGALLPVQNVLGIRLVGFLGNSYTAEVHISLHGGSASSTVSSVSRTVRANHGDHRIEIRMIDYALEIQRMLAGADGLDATVSIKLQVGSHSTLLRFARYACELERLSSISSVGLPQSILASLSLEEIQAVSIRALRMDAPGDEPIELAPYQSEGVVTGNWIFPEHSLSPGQWLIFPTSDASLIFRPMLWMVTSPGNSQTEEAQPATGLLYALNISDTLLREQSLEESIRNLAGDFVHADWQIVEQIANNLGHLPLSTLDIWRIFSRSVEGMAALAMRLSSWPTGFVERFSTELPMMWEFNSLVAWCASMEALRLQCNTWYGSEFGKDVFKSHLDRRVQDLTSANPALRVLLEIAKAKITGDLTQEIVIAQQGFMDSVFSDQLFGGTESYLQQLLRNNAESKWPVGFKGELDNARRSGVADYLCPTSHGYHDAVINVPLLLAVGAAMNGATEWCREANAVRELRTIQTFAPEWFAEAFDLTVARSIAKHAVQIQ